MTSVPTLLGEEFNRRRKLRLQQVREQSKDIAKKIRQRTEMEKHKSIMELDAKKEKLYLERQEKIVEELERQHELGLKKIGSGHCDAINLKNEEIIGAVDQSKSRGKFAAKILREKKQKDLDDKKKILDRKLQAREIANELSREKSASVANKIKSQDKDLNKEDATNDCEKKQNDLNKAEKETVNMSVQCDGNELPKELEPSMPILLEEDERNQINQPTTSSCSLGAAQESNVLKKPNLFAVSDEMPSSLRGTSKPHVWEGADLFKPSNIIAEYVQNRGMRLREPDPIIKSSSDNLQKIKQTIIKTRATEGRSEKTQTSTKGNPVIVYDHSTRDTQNVNYTEKLVDRNDQTDNDAYSQAVKEASMMPTNAGDPKKDLNEQRHKVATSKQKIQKEYEDTIAFLKMLPKQKDARPFRKAYMPECRQQQQKEKQQKKMEQEYKNIEKECRKQCMDRKHSKSPVIDDYNEDEVSDCVKLSTDERYSWIPVPESDRLLAIHKIPNTKERKPSQSVTFDDNCSYHEYRSQHRHTPPTKEKDCGKELINQSSNSSTNNSNSSAENVENKNKESGGAISDKNRIIIYKIIDSHLGMSDVAKAKNSKMENGVVTSLTALDKEIRKGLNNKKKDSKRTVDLPITPETNVSTLRSVEQLNEGIYKVVKEKGSRDNSIMKCHVTNVEMELWKTIVPSKYWWDNITNGSSEEVVSVEKETGDRITVCKCGSLKENKSHQEGNIDLKNSGAGDSQIRRTESAPTECNKCAGALQGKLNDVIQSSVASTTPFKTKDNLTKADKADGNFYIGASGFLKDEDYEVIIQLRKKDIQGKVNDKVTTAVSAQNSLHACEKTKVDEEAAEIVAGAKVIEENIKSNDKLPISKETDPIKTVAPNFEPVVENIQETKSNEQKKIGTSICTQTSFSTPTQKSYFQMSSSTSTTYLSPPDIILPKCLKNKQSQSEYVDSNNIQYNVHEEKKERKIDSSENKYTKSKSHKCKKYMKNATNKRACTKKRGSGNANLYTVFEKLNTRRSAKLSGALKGYVDKVLQLNKDGVKVFEVATQHCSSVSTPGSSVINVSSNMDDKTNYLEELTKRISQEIIDKIKIDQINHRPRPLEVKIKRRTKQQPCRVQRKHKIKSLNVSRNLNRYFKNNNDMSSLQSTSSNSYVEKPKQLQKQKDSPKITCPKPSNELSSNSKTSEASSSKSNNVNILPSTSKEKKCKNKCTGKSKSQPSSISLQLHNQNNYPINTSTQTSDERLQNTDAMMVQLEKDKLQNMEKIAVLTQKCTERLSHLSRVLEEVRRKKPAVYISTTDTSSEYERVESRVNVKDVQTVHGEAPPKTEALKNTIDKDLTLPQETREEATLTRNRGKPPPVLTRAHLKLPEENVIPHELSTVPEADTPKSLKQRKSQSPNSTNNFLKEETLRPEEKKGNLSQNKIPNRSSYTNKEPADSIEEPTKLLDLSKYNELMLKPFITLEDYAKQCNVGVLDEGSNLDDIPKEEICHDDISSLHSDGSLPDVISELLKQNIVYEPFKFDSISNINSTAISSDSSASMLLLSKKKKCQFDSLVMRNSKNKSKSVDTSDSLSISSNPDLETSFKKMGMAWASSTLKKTKERLALSSSTSTSTSTSIKFPPKRSEKPKNTARLPLDVGDNKTNKNTLKESNMSKIDPSKHETSLARSMLVKEYLTKELAKKITFTNVSKDESNMHYTSLYSTKFPAECVDETSDELADNNKTSERLQQPGSQQRTSTPVHLYKSVHYNTISSNSNLDDLSSVKVTSSSFKNYSNSEKDELSIPNYSLRMKKDKS